MTAPPHSGPLAGLKVVELGQLIAGPFAARILAEYGADVVKVETPGTGDPLRTWRKLHDGTSLWWRVQARNKRSITADLRVPEGQEIVRRLAAEADILIENFRPGTLEKWGLGFDALHALNRRLVMVRLSGYGQTGPYRERPGFGVIGEAMGGIRYTTGSPDRPPARTGVSIGDTLAAHYAVIGALMSVIHVVRNGGPGQVVDVALHESVFNCMESLVPEYGVYGEIRERSGGALPGIVPTDSYPCRDGFVLIAGNGDSIFRRLMRAIGRPDLADDPRLARNDGRAAQVELIDGAIADWTGGRSIDEVLALMNEAGVPAGRVYSVADIVADPHYRARDMIIETTLPDGTPMPVPGIAPKLSATPGVMRTLGPDLGEHTDEVLRGLGYSDDAVAELRRKGAV
ncbi:CaiB/BaiF CoA-transferase family protein [Enterovirga sp.]|uniref:CaiB/BaiF CoA transferase family protein n=1 Tax=Enterovirga sp. TaxID=2026350 RepID=UPI002626C84F|nr:CaiB/BaiF CoA-transferase family protein [Enterovirga sp.]MDB5590434.1 L-carnitine dehydratase/bile acid-inducible protein [Enterovirga sp.]